MYQILLSTLLLCMAGTLLGGDPNKIDPLCTSFESVERKNSKNYNLSDTYPNLRTIDLEVPGGQRSQLVLSGDFPVLESVNIESSSGNITAAFTGNIPELTDISIHSNSGKLNLDFRAKWRQNCHIMLETTSGDMRIKLPRGVGVKVRTKTTSGEVTSSELKKEGWLVHGDAYTNSLYGIAPITLTIEARATSGNIDLN